MIVNNGDDGVLGSLNFPFCVILDLGDGMLFVLFWHLTFLCLSFRVTASILLERVLHH